MLGTCSKLGLPSTDLAQSRCFFEPREMFFCASQTQMKLQALPPRSSQRTEASSGVSTRLQKPEQIPGESWYHSTARQHLAHSGSGDPLQHPESIEAKPKTHKPLTHSSTTCCFSFQAQLQRFGSVSPCLYELPHRPLQSGTVGGDWAGCSHLWVIGEGAAWLQLRAIPISG